MISNVKSRPTMNGARTMAMMSSSAATVVSQRHPFGSPMVGVVGFQDPPHTGLGGR
jgi:hypothetical protein